MKLQNKAVTQYLFQWEGYSEYEASRENAEAFEAKYPTFVTS